MAITIIKGPRTLYEDWSVTITCQDCEAIYAIEEEDVLVRLPEYMGPYGYHVYSRCPFCEHYIPLEDDMPSLVKRRIKKHYWETTKKRWRFWLW